MKISLIHPSRGRPDLAQQAAYNWLSKTSGLNQTEYILSVDNDDLSEYSVEPPLNEFYELHREKRILLKNDNRSIVDAVNNAAKIAAGDLLIVMSDDFLCPQNWDKKLIEIAKEEEPGFVIKTEDGSGGWICTLPIVDRAWYDRFGYIYYPHYRHMFCDTELTSAAVYMDSLVDATDLRFTHQHYSFTGEKPDEIAERAGSTWNRGQQLYIERYFLNFGLKGEEIKQKFKYSTHKGQLHWLMMNNCPI